MRGKTRVLFCLFVLAALLLSAVCLSAESLVQQSGITATISSNGGFTIAWGSPAWPFGGQVPGQVTSISAPSGGADTNGPFEETTIAYTDSSGNSWQAIIRTYRYIATARISATNLTAVPNKGPALVLNQFPITSHHFSYSGRWGRQFGQLDWMGKDSPWLFFNDQLKSAILSPADDFMSARQRWFNDGSPYGAIALETDSSNPVLPAGFDNVRF